MLIFFVITIIFLVRKNRRKIKKIYIKKYILTLTNNITHTSLPKKYTRFRATIEKVHTLSNPTPTF